jgi:uncharacterized CHY-type Zn-finger protein
MVVLTLFFCMHCSLSLLVPQRKAYLRQNIMASHYIVAQQRRMNGSGGSSTAATPTALAAAGLRDGLKLAAPAGTTHATSSGSGGFVAAAVASAQQQQQQQQQRHAHQHCEGAAGAAAQPGAARRAPAVPRYNDAAAGVLGCRHYRRRSMLVAPCCDTPHVCRLCHDEASDHQVGPSSETLLALSIPCSVGVRPAFSLQVQQEQQEQASSLRFCQLHLKLPSFAPAVLSLAQHRDTALFDTPALLQVDRYAVSEMVCLECATRQPVAGEPACHAALAVCSHAAAAAACFAPPCATSSRV